MLEILSRGFKAAQSKLTGVTELTEDNIESALRDVRMSLLEADVAFSVTKTFLQRVKESAIGQQVKLRATGNERSAQATPAQHFIRICNEELVALMGPVDSTIHWAKKGPTIIMMVGLQGSGKTTTTGKLARYLEKTHKKKPMLVAADIYRPAAVDQLNVLGQRLGMPVFHSPGKRPQEICEDACKAAYLQGCDVVLLDTAGRLAIDEPLMQELLDIKNVTQPHEIFFVCDAMIGQDAVNTAKAFHDRLQTTGFILTKLDGDARGGSALSIKEITGQPIKFLGMGESLDKLEEFRPEGLASRILGMGDIIGLMKDFEQVADAEKLEKDAEKMMRGKFDMQDFLEQIGMLQQMGSLRDLIDKIPGLGGGLPAGMTLDEKEPARIKAIISSMTMDERRKPELLLASSWDQVTKAAQAQKKNRTDLFQMSRVRRIAKGSGRKETDVVELLQRFAMMRQMMSMMGSQTGLLGKIPGFKNLAKMKQMASAAQNFGDFGSMMGPQPGLLNMGKMTTRSTVDKNREKRKRQAAKAARKQNKKR